MVKCEDVIKQAERLIDVSYDDMDCQDFIERAIALAASGVDTSEMTRQELVAFAKKCKKLHEYKGCNEMYRSVRGLVRAEFAEDFYGTIPPCTALFIWENDGGEIARGYTDGLGNASHVGFTTGKLGDTGAIHSSKSKGKVCHSKFKGTSINGGWNYIGFFKEIDYGPRIESMLAEDEKEEERILLNATVIAQKGKTVNLRAEPNKNKKVIMAVPVGSQVFVVETAGDEWCMVEYGGKQGFMMREFLDIEEDPIMTDDEPTQSKSIEERLDDIENKLKLLMNEWSEKMGWG